MIRYICLIVMLLHSFFNNNISEKEINSIAVIPFQVLGDIKHSKIYSHGLPDAISHRLSKLVNLKVLERIKLSEVLQELTLQESGFTSDEDVNKIGKLTGADIIITGNIHNLSSDIRFHIKGICVSTGEIIFSILKYFTSSEFYDFSNLEYSISDDILKAVKNDHTIDQQLQQNKISERSIEYFKRYSEGLFYFDNGKKDLSKQYFKLYAEEYSNDYWIQEVRKEAQKMFNELNQLSN